jgi:hypothetical protein
MSAPGKLVPFRQSTAFIPGVSVAGGRNSYLALFPLGPRVFFAGRSASGSPLLTSGQWLGDHAGNTWVSVTPVDGQQLVRSRAQSGMMLFRGRLFLLYEGGVGVLDALDGSVTATRWAQLPQPLINFVFPNTGAPSQTLGTVVSYAAILRRKYSDGYELISPASPIQRYYQTSPSGQKNNISVTLQSPSQAGDILEIYRSREVAAPGPTADTESGTTLFMCASVTLPAGVGSYAVADPGAPNQIIGRELYTNPGQETLQSSGFPPPVAKCFAAFKGYAFYANAQEAGAFTLAFPGGFGPLTTADQRLAGFGTRTLTGNLTNGSNTVTGISAADIVGIKKYQFVLHPNVPGFSYNTPTTYITSVGASSFTMSAAATATQAATEINLNDVVELYGVRLAAGTLNQLFACIGVSSILPPLAVTVDKTVGDDGMLVFGQRMSISPYRSPPNGNAINARATNAANLVPIPADLSADAPAQTYSATWRANKLMWSWEQQPERCPVGNYAFIGSGEIYALATTRDVMWIFASDGIWRFTGYGTRSSGIQANWRVDLVDRTVVLAAPSAYCVLRDAVFAYTNIGLVKVSDEVGVKPLTRGVIGDLLPGRRWIDSDDITMAADDDNDRVFLNVTTGDNDAGTLVSDCYVWSEQYGVFTKLSQWVSGPSTLMRVAYDRVNGGLLVGLGNINTLYTYWIDPAGTQFAAATGDFQPQYGPDPGSSKQWIEMCAMFDKASAGKLVTPRFNGVAYDANALVQYPLQDDARSYFGVSMEAPAVANLLAPGFSIPPQNTITELRGLAMRYELIAEEPLFT